MANHFKYVIVGGGLAAASAVEGIRELDGQGSIALFGKETHLPYDRPPLSKGLWTGKSQLKDLPVHNESYYTRNNVHLHLGREIVSIDRQKKQVLDSDSTRFGYEKLLIATGGSPRSLSFGGNNVHYYRTRDDYQFLRDAADRLSHFILIGGGFIGAELAAALNMQGKNVSIVFPDRYLLQKLLPEDLAGYVTQLYMTKGVSVVSEDLPTSIERSEGTTRVTTKSGNTIAGDMAIAAIGLNLHLEMAMRAGLRIDQGIVVNNWLQTSDANIYAAGDVACFPAKLLEKSIRVEHWNNAQVQGKYAGQNMTGAKHSYDYLPYFYSDLFELGFEAVGEIDAKLETFADWREEFREGVVYYLDQGKLRGVLLWNVWEKVDAARHLINPKHTYKHPTNLRGKI
ncbi:MAG: NAD(P)/FAD-dependent oxidoreductase [Ignavibacteriae bacterium]|nr:NAD(P)/FAD-dependent oxidoreductase [Ignavibacteriota bacterium]